MLRIVGDLCIHESITNPKIDFIEITAALAGVVIMNHTYIVAKTTFEFIAVSAVKINLYIGIVIKIYIRTPNTEIKAARMGVIEAAP